MLFASFLFAPLIAVVTTTPFRSGLDIEGRRCHTVRIPAVRTAPNGDLVAAFDARWNNINDLGTGKGEEVEIAASRSTDGGRTWSAPKIIHDFPWTATEKWGGTDPSLIVDRETKTIFCLYNVRNHANPRRHLRWVQSSTDNGLTWSAPRDITAELFRPGWTRERYSFMTSGGGTQLKDGTLLAVINDFAAHEANVFGSSDHGKAWRFFGKPVGVADETKIVELGDGTWMLNARSWAPQGNYRREVYLSKNHGETWVSCPDNGLLDTGANGALWKTRFPDGCSALLLSNCHSEGRQNLTLKVSFDEGKTWPKTFSLWPGIAAYSDITELPDGRIGILYEAGDRELYERFDFAVFSPEELAGPVPVEQTLREIRSRYEAALVGDCAAWWLAFSIDPEGGFFTYLDREGKVYDKRKEPRLQVEMTEMFERLANSRFGNDRIRQAAEHGKRYLAQHPEMFVTISDVTAGSADWRRPFDRAEEMMRLYALTRNRAYLDRFVELDRWIRTELRDPLYHEYFQHAAVGGKRASDIKGSATKGFCRIPRYFLLVFESVDRILGDNGQGVRPYGLSPEEAAKWELTFADEFETPTVDTNKWYAGYRNGQFEYYRRVGAKHPGAYTSPECCYEISNGTLKLRIDERCPTRPHVGSSAVSCFMTSDHRYGKDRTEATVMKKFGQKYGWFEMRCKIAKGPGLESAFWLHQVDPLHQEFTPEGRPNKAEGALEFDIFEAWGTPTNQVRAQMNVHFTGDGHYAIAEPDPDNDFHVFALEWEEGLAKFYYDGKVVKTYRGPTPQREMFVLMALFHYRCLPDHTVTELTYPRDFEVDYVRVFRRKAGVLCPDKE